jgi:hypothetical protein
MRFLIKLAIAVLVAVGLGYFSARMAIEEVAGSQSVQNGSWGINTTIGSAQMDPYSKAFVALHGLLALNKSEAIYFFAGEDAAGDSLNGNCTYKVSGTGIQARWWTVTIYGEDDYLIPSDQSKYALSVHDLGTDSFSFKVGPDIAETDLGLSTGNENRFNLTLRAYNPMADLLNNLEGAKLPVIEKETCNE